MRKVLTFTGLLIATIVVTLSSATAASTTTEVVRFPITLPMVNACNGDLLLVVGTQQVQMHTTVTDGKLLFETSDWVKDVDAFSVYTGDRYVFNEEYGDLTQSFVNGTLVARQRDTMNVVQVGEPESPIDDDMHIHITSTLRISSTGEPTTDDSFSVDCH